MTHVSLVRFKNDVGSARVALTKKNVLKDDFLLSGVF